MNAELRNLDHTWWTLAVILKAWSLDNNVNIPWEYLKRQILGSNPRPTESETLKMGLAICVLTSLPGDSDAHLSLRLLVYEDPVQVERRQGIAKYHTLKYFNQVQMVRIYFKGGKDERWQDKLENQIIIIIKQQFRGDKKAEKDEYGALSLSCR